MFERLIEAGLVKQKRYDNGLSVFKYSRKVFYDRLWDTDPLLLEARGIVLNDAGEKVIWPFTKVFNHMENGTDCELDRTVCVVRKVNGFMAAARIYEGELIVSTTGSLDSDFAVLARKWIEELNVGEMRTNLTYLFEICDPSDPHIIEEVPGAYLIGARLMQNGYPMAHEYQLDDLAQEIGAVRPEWEYMTFREAHEKAEKCKHEGFMIRDGVDDVGHTIMKIKSPHYLAKKFLMRMGAKKVDAMFEDKEEFLKSIDEEFYSVVHYITRWHDAEGWKAKTDQERREVIEMYFHEIVYDAKKGEY